MKILKKIILTLLTLNFLLIQTSCVTHNLWANKNGVKPWDLKRNMFAIYFEPCNTPCPKGSSETREIKTLSTGEKVALTPASLIIDIVLFPINILGLIGSFIFISFCVIFKND